ncbi:MAG: peptidoglycan-binding domain-containing protein [Acidimicrobiales bacterium]
MTRLRQHRRTVLAASVIAVAALLVAAIARNDADRPIAAAPTTVALQLGDLTETITLDGTIETSGSLTLSHQADPDIVVETIQVTANAPDTSPAAGQGAGPAPAQTQAREVAAQVTVTRLADIGATVEPGGVLYATDGSPTLLVPGDQAAWRTIESGDTGTDVTQIETYLASIGFDPGTVDDQFTSSTRSAVANWQDSIGQEATGQVRLGSLVFWPQDLTIAGHIAAIGEVIGDGDPVLSATGSTLRARLTIDAPNVGRVNPGDTVEVRLPGSGTVEATVTVVVNQVDGGATALAALADRPNIAATPVAITARRTATLQHDVLTVPANALIRLDAGTYALRRPNGSLVEVEVIDTSGSTIAITGDDLAPGDEVLTP